MLNLFISGNYPPKLSGAHTMIKQAMEDGYGDEQQELPPGFRFHPTDEELVTYYLSRKAADHGFSGAGVIGEVDLNKCEPWDLPRRGAKMGEKEWYFFCVRDRKYPVGLRTNRATDAGYWKATGKDKEVRRGKSLVGMKKTLVFYRGRAPKGDKTSWVMHEYRLDDNFYLCNLPSKAAKNEWVICRVFQKSSSSSFAGGDEKNLPPATAAVIKVPCVARMGSSFHRDDATIGTGPLLPPLMGFPSRGSKMAGTAPITSGANHVTCFSSAAAGYTSYEELLMGSCHSSSSLFSASSSVLPLAKHPEEAAGRMQLLERGGSVAKEAGLASDINPEISSSLLLLLSEGTEVISSQIKVPSVPSGNIMPLGDCMWNY